MQLKIIIQTPVVLMIELTRIKTKLDMIKLKLKVNTEVRNLDMKKLSLKVNMEEKIKIMSMEAKQNMEESNSIIENLVKKK